MPSLASQIDDLARSGQVVCRECAWYADLLPLPALEAHKYSRGHARGVAGSALYPGAAVLAARAASRGGAGYVTLAVPEPVMGVAQCHLVTVPVCALPAGECGAFASEAAACLPALLERADGVCFGSGATVCEGTGAVLAALLRDCHVPLLLDADALSVLCRLDAAQAAAHAAPLVLTPHEGEMRRLVHAFVPECEGFDGGVLAARAHAASRLAHTLDATVVFKGPVTLVASPDGAVLASDHGSPVLATAGTGDVLAGIVCALLAAHLAPADACALGVYLHGSAARVAAMRLGHLSVVATDVIDALPEAARALEGGVW